MTAQHTCWRHLTRMGTWNERAARAPRGWRCLIAITGREVAILRWRFFCWCHRGQVFRAFDPATIVRAVRDDVEAWAL